MSGPLYADRSGMDEWPATSLLAGMSAATRRALLAVSVPRAYRSGERLMGEGDRSTFVVVLRSGFVKVTAALENGREALLAIRTRGDTVGELAGLDGGPRSATVTACGPVAGGIVHRPEFLRFLRRYPEASFAMNRMNAGRLRWANQRRLDFTGFGAPERVIRSLAELVGTYGVRTPDGLACAVRVTQAELAALASTSVETVEKVVYDLQKTGVLTWRYAMFTVTDHRRLHELAGLGAPNP